MSGWLESAGLIVLGGVMLLLGLLFCWKSFVGARQMNLSRVNEHGVRVWKNATDSIVAPWQIRGLYAASAGWAFVAFLGLGALSSGLQGEEGRNASEAAYEAVEVNGRNEAAAVVAQGRVEEQREAHATPAPDPNTLGQVYGLTVRRKNNQETLLFRDTADELVLTEVDPTIWHACPSDGTFEFYGGGRALVISSAFGDRPPLQAGDLLRSTRESVSWPSATAMRAGLQQAIPWSTQDRVRSEWRRTGSFPAQIQIPVVVYGTNRSETGALQSRVLCGDLVATCSAGAGGTAPTCGL